jgi:hypothetical protein
MIPPTRHRKECLDHELRENVRSRGTERHAHADLAGPFGHRDQHDVHDSDAAHEQADARDACEQKAQDLGRLLLRGQELLAIDDGEVVVPSRWQPMHPPQDALDGDHRLRQLGPALHFHGDGLDAVVTGDAIPRCLDRNVDIIVWVAETDRALHRIDADDLERHCLDQQCAADEICGGLPELLRHIAADHHNTPPRPAVLPRQHPARLQGVTVDLGMLRRRADHVQVEIAVAELELLPALLLRYDGDKGPAVVGQSPGIVDGQQLLVTCHALREPHACRHCDHVRAQRRKLLVDCTLRAMTERKHGDHRAHPDHHAQHREHGAKRIGHNGTERYPKDLRHVAAAFDRCSAGRAGAVVPSDAA